MPDKYYKIFYTKDLKKKRKVYSEGVLHCSEKSTKIFNQSGQCILKSNQKIASLQEGADLYLGNYYITVQQQISQSKFKSGKAFMVQPLPIRSVIISKKKNSCQSKKIQQNQNPQRKLITLESGLQIENGLLQKLRPHQIQGINFMYQCLSGKKGNLITGCILADFMGLGKTLQTISLAYSMLRMQKVKKTIVVCPLTLVSVWKRQCQVWLSSKLNPSICLGDNQQITKIVKDFAKYDIRMLLISYEAFYKHINTLEKKCDLIIFDQGHRLKNNKSKIFMKLKLYSCKKRILLTGTPIQNNLQELFACISLVNPLMFQNQVLFRNVFQKPIMAGMANLATSQQRQLAQARTKELADRIKQFSLRRKADILQKYLPQKKQHLIFFKLTPVQKLWYDRTIQIKQKQNQTNTMPILNQLRKLFIHPLIFKKDCVKRGNWYNFQQTIQDQNSSYKLSFTLEIVKQCILKGQKIVIVSYYTENLDYINQILKQMGIQTAQLDGRKEGRQRQSIIQKFKREKSVLLLSGKAGGTGLTLTCATKMIMLEPDWNPSNDSQVMGRIWRQGQQQPVQIYRLIIISSFEQKILQRQHLKQALAQKLIDQKKNTRKNFDFFNLKKLFIQNFQTCLTFSSQYNKIKQYRQNRKQFPSQGVIHLQIIKSHNSNYNNEQQKDHLQVQNQNQFQNAMFLDSNNEENDSDYQDDQQNIQFQIGEKIKEKPQAQRKSGSLSSNELSFKSKDEQIIKQSKFSFKAPFKDSKNNQKEQQKQQQKMTWVGLNKKQQQQQNNQKEKQSKLTKISKKRIFFQSNTQQSQSTIGYFSNLQKIEKNQFEKPLFNQNEETNEQQENKNQNESQSHQIFKKQSNRKIAIRQLNPILKKIKKFKDKINLQSQE